MFKLYTAFTKEIDSPEWAVREIMEQLKPDRNMLQNTIGIVQFYHEFTDTGVYQAIMDILPFEVVGCVSTFIGIGGKYGDFGLSVAMLTSDNVNFSVRTLEFADIKSREEIFEEINGLCTELCADEMPKMVMPFMTPLQHFSADDLVAAVNGLPNPFPLFGTVAFNDENKLEANLVVSGSKISSVMYAFVAFYGNIEPKFYVTNAFDYDDDIGKTAEITEAEGSILKTIDGIYAVDFLKNQGIIAASNDIVNASIWALPAVLTNTNGTKVVRAFLGVVEDTSYIFSTGVLEVGAKISFSFLDGEKTLASAEKLMSKVIETDACNMIAYSCAVRSWSLGSQHHNEMKIIAECADKYLHKNNTPLNYCVSYAGGEICPVFSQNGKLVNALHNYSLTVCLLSETG